MVYGGIGALIFSVYLVYDTQMMMGGGHKYSISPEEYIFAAVALYLDIINLFINIHLRSLGCSFCKVSIREAGRLHSLIT